MNYKFIKKNNNKAFVSMIALLLANIFLIIGLSVFNIAMREVILSSGAKESLFAFYAADGGMECALYWDVRENSFSTDTPSSPINCSGQDVSVTFIQDCGTDCSRNIFSLAYPPDRTGTCVQVEVVKEFDSDTLIKSTLIKSFGQNTCDENNERRVERAWKVTY